MAQLVEKQIGDSTPVWEMQTASAGQIDACCGLGRGVNLLDNWYFIGGGSQQGGGQFPINQRGNTSVTGVSGLTLAPFVDEVWVNNQYASESLVNATLTAEGITAICKTEYQGFYWKFENSRIPKTGTITISLLYKMSGHASLQFNGGSSTDLPESEAFTLKSFTVSYSSLPSSGSSSIAIFNSPNQQTTITVAAIKLELGPVQTLAHKDSSGNWVLNDPPPNFQQELAKCQAYYLPIGGNTFGYCGTASFDPNNRVVFMDIPTPVTMAKKPSIITSSSAIAVATQGGTVFSLPNPTVDEVHANGVRIFFGNLTAPTTWSIGPVGVDNLRFAFSVDI